jgi:ribosomal protein S21
VSFSFSFRYVCIEAAHQRRRFVRDLEESVSPTLGARRGQVARPKLDRCGALRLGRKVHRQKKLAIRPAGPYLEKIVGTGSAVGAESSVLPPHQGRLPWLIPSGLRPSQNDAGAHATVLCCCSRSAAIVPAKDAVRFATDWRRPGRPPPNIAVRLNGAGAMPVHVLVRDNNVYQALRALKKKLQREGVFRDHEKPSVKATREKDEAARPRPQTGS